MSTFPLLITCPKGIPPFLRLELEALGLPVLAEHVAAVGTAGTAEDGYRLNLYLRTAHRVLAELAAFPARDADGLYRGVSGLPWETLVPEDGYVCVTASVENPTIRDQRFAALRCKDAVVDRIKARTGKRPDSGPDRGRSVVHLYWKDDRVVLYRDLSGEPLSRRGYRKIPLQAPMQETLAAAVVLATGWNGDRSFVNPFCGSGTLAIEAALLALDRAPGLLRSNFGFMHWQGYDAAAWSVVREEARRRGRKACGGRIIATDRDPRAVEAAQKNAATAGVDHLITFRTCDFAETEVPPGGGVVVMNPPYGERLGDAAGLEPLYRVIGDFLKQRCNGYTGYLFTGSPALARKVSLKPMRAWDLYNSSIACRLLAYDLYPGTRKVKKERRPEA